MRILTLLFVAMLSLPLLAADAPKGFIAAPKEQIENLKLLLPDAGCSLSAPNADWVWLTPASGGGKNFMCFSKKSGAGITVSVGELVNDMDEHTKQELMAGCKQMAAKSGATVSNEKFVEAQIPIPGKSWRLSYDVKAEARKIAAIFYYVRTAGKAFVTLQGASVDGLDTPTFRTFVSALQLTAVPVEKK